MHEVYVQLKIFCGVQNILTLRVRAGCEGAMHLEELFHVFTEGTYVMKLVKTCL